MPIPTLYVEGNDDIVVINALLFRHGLDLERGKKHLKISDLKSVELLLSAIPDAIRASTDGPVGFVVDIDIDVLNRWAAIRNKLREVGISTPVACPSGGFFGQLASYPHRFGVWLMPDCQTDGQMLEDLVQTLIPDQDPLWNHSKVSTETAAQLVDAFNATQAEDSRYRRFSDIHKTKAEVHAWLAWQRDPGIALGAAINNRVLQHDSPKALAFLLWLKSLYGFQQITSV